MKLSYLFLGMMASTTLLQAEGAVCPKCDAIREYNAKYHHNYEYFEDYEKDQTDAKQKNENTPLTHNLL